MNFIQRVNSALQNNLLLRIIVYIIGILFFSILYTEYKIYRAESLAITLQEMKEQRIQKFKKLDNT
jgi:preprotein translocase subunit SecY